MSSDVRHHSSNSHSIVVPAAFNIGVDVACRQDSADLALLEVDAHGRSRSFSFGEVVKLANRAANVFRAHGLSRGDRVAILLSQRHETAVAHVAVYLCGMIAVPLFVLFGEEALEFRLRDCGARAVVTDSEGVSKLSKIRERLPALGRIYCVDSPMGDAVDFHAALEHAADQFEPEKTSADDPALIIYTSGTTGNPKGALHAHRVLLGHLPGVEFPHEGFPQRGDCFWTPADWAWIGGLLDVLLPCRL
jgi:acetyl-CoA synthetase